MEKFPGTQFNPERPSNLESSKEDKEELEFARYFELKNKEKSDQLSQKEFDELLSIDFKLALRDNPPIEETFDPELELAAIKSAPAKEKKEQLVIYKEKLARQREAFADCRLFIERSINFDNKISAPKLYEWVDQFASNYGFEERQKEKAYELIDTFIEKRQKAAQFLLEHQGNPDELIKELTGKDIDDSDQIAGIYLGPMSIDIYTYDSTAKKLWGKPVKKGDVLGAFAKESQDGVNYNVINMAPEPRETYKDPLGKNSLAHEHEHQKHKLFQLAFEYLKNKDSDQELEQFQNSDNLQTQKFHLENYMQDKMDYGLDRARDEMIASLKDLGIRNLETKLQAMFFKKDGLYDYLKDFRDKVPEETPSKLMTMYEAFATKYLVLEYKSIISDSLYWFKDLTKIYKLENSVALMTDIPLKNWPKVIRRLLARRNRPRSV